MDGSLDRDILLGLDDGESSFFGWGGAFLSFCSLGGRGGLTSSLFGVSFGASFQVSFSGSFFVSKAFLFGMEMGVGLTGCGDVGFLSR
jgi:hypothetical protein